MPLFPSTKKKEKRLCMCKNFLFLFFISYFNPFQKVAFCVCVFFYTQTFLAVFVLTRASAKTDKGNSRWDSIKTWQDPSPAFTTTPCHSALCFFLFLFFSLSIVPLTRRAREILKNQGLNVNSILNPQWHKQLKRPGFFFFSIN